MFPSKRQKVDSTSPSPSGGDDPLLRLLKNILVNIEPQYLETHCGRLADNEDKVIEFVYAAVATDQYPALENYVTQKNPSTQQKQYTTEFNIENFLNLIPNPLQYFNKLKEKRYKVDAFDKYYALCYLRTKFEHVNLRTIREVLMKNNESVIQTYRELESFPLNTKKEKRAETRIPSYLPNISLLQEIAYCDHQHEIELYVNRKKLQEDEERERAKEAGLVLTCSCCFADDVMMNDVCYCESGCIYCKDCVKTAAEIAFGDGKLNFPCLGHCTSHFSLRVLQAVLPPTVFSAIALKKQDEEVKAAGVEDLTTCPFCDFTTIPARNDILFRCFNPQCMKESCRICKKLSHAPLRCDEFEEGENEHIMNEITERLLSRMRSINAPAAIQRFGPCGHNAVDSAMVVARQDPSSDRLTWERPPSTVLVVKKINDIAIYCPFTQLLEWLIEEKHMICYVEQSVFDDRHLGEVSQFSEIKNKLKTLGMGKDDRTLSDIDFVICMGGDGTLLYASGLFQQSVPPIMSFSFGSLGFLTPFHFDGFEDRINEVLEGNVPLILRSRLRCIIIRGDSNKSVADEATDVLVLNDVVVKGCAGCPLTNYDLFLDGRHITNIQGDGLILSTPTGSTAYAKSAGSSLVHPTVSGTIVAAICPDTISWKPIVVPAGVEIKVSVSPDSRDRTAFVSFDGRNDKTLYAGDSLRVTTSIYPVPSICAQDQVSDWFDALAECLNWNVRKLQKPMQ